MKVELKAAAKLAGVDVHRAAKTIRKNPLLSEEVHIEESLVNLEESYTSYRVAGDTLERYPKVHKHLLREQRVILHHCIGSIFRMIQGEKNLPSQYTEKDISKALTSLIRMVVDESARVSKKVDDEILEIVAPFLSWRQKFRLKYRHMITEYVTIPTPVKVFIRKIFPIRQYR